jgi:hypothetical protein
MLGGKNMNVEIIVDGNKLDLNDFVRKVTFNVTHGLIRSLRDVNEYSKVEIRIER